MEIYETQSEIGKRKSWLLSSVVVLLVSLGVLLLMQGIAIALLPVLFNISLEDLASLLTGNYNIPNGRMAFLFVQGLGGGIGLWLAAYIISSKIDKANLHWDIQFSKVKLFWVLIVLGLTLGGMFFNAFLIDFNSHLVLPESMSGLEAWMKESENQMMELTKFLTDFENIQEFIAGIFVIGVLAGIGEEVFFRGLIQPKIRLYTGSIHWGIWLTAIIFSAIHMQFYGFLPRVFLGAIFGYLYVYSGSLVYPILAHIFNNSITVLLVYLAKQGNIEFDIEATDQVSYPLAFLGLLVLLAGIYYFKRLNLRNDGKLG
jgi:membrane protease YdiL (CAAX protease family)